MAQNAGNDPTNTTITIAVVAVIPSQVLYTPSSFNWTVDNVSTSPFPTPSTAGDPVQLWSIDPAVPKGLAFDTTTGTISGQPTEVTAANSYTVTASNSGGVGTTKVTLQVLAVAPTGLTYSHTASADFVLRIGKSFTTTPSITGNFSAGNGTITFSISPSTLPTGLHIDSTTGVISGQALELVYPPETFTVTAANSGGSTEATVTISVLQEPPTDLTYPTSGFTYPSYVPTSRLYQYTLNKATSSELKPTHSGGSLTVCTISPSLSDNTGLSFNPSTCAISGTPDKLSTDGTEYVVAATNTGNNNTYDTILINVVAVKPSDVSYSPSSFVYTVESNYSGFPAPVASGGNITKFTINPDLPDGLHLDSQTGIITGIPTIPSASTVYTVTASNSGGDATALITVQVKAFTPSGLSYAGYCGSSLPLTLDQSMSPITPTLTSTNHSKKDYGDVTFSVVPANLTNLGISVDPSTGILSGTPSSVLYPAQQFVINASNSGGSDLCALNITVKDQPVSNLQYPTTGFTEDPVYNDGVYKYIIEEHTITPAQPTHQGDLLRATLVLFVCI